MIAKDELESTINKYKLEVIAWNIHVQASDGSTIHSLLKCDYNILDKTKELRLLDVEYSSGHGSQNLFGCVLLENGFWLSRAEYDGAEYWKINHQPDMRLFESKDYIAGNTYEETLYNILKDEERMHELHLTIESIDDVEKFKKDCNEIRVKPIILDLQTKEAAIKDVMTSYTEKCTYTQMQEIYCNQARKFKNKGYKVVRFKIETTSNVNTILHHSGYFESHIHLHLSKDFDTLKLQELCQTYNVHLSKNTFKSYEDYDVVMATLRSYDSLKSFKDKLNTVVDVLNSVCKVGEHHIEYAIYDSNINHDKAWIES